jgi:hypothetical protein
MLKRYAVLLGAFVVVQFYSAAVSTRLQSAEPSKLNDTLVWAAHRAALKSVDCTPRLDNGARTSTPRKEETGIAKELSLPLLFRSGRYKLTELLDSGTAEGESERVIRFSPREPGEQLEAYAGESGSLNKVLNQLAGEVFLSRETGEITRIYSDLTESLWLYPKWYLPPFKLRELTFQFTFEAGVPKSLGIEAQTTFGSRHYPLSYDCGT